MQLKRKISCRVEAYRSALVRTHTHPNTHVTNYSTSKNCKKFKIGPAGELYLKFRQSFVLSIIFQMFLLMRLPLSLFEGGAQKLTHFFSILIYICLDKYLRKTLLGIKSTSKFHFNVYKYKHAHIHTYKPPLGNPPNHSYANRMTQAVI